MIAPVALDQSGPVARVLAVRPLVWLGVISYGVYLWHWPIFLVLNGERTGLSGYALFAVRCVATLTAAVVSWWVIEQPVRRWRPVHVPLVRFAGATVATAVVVTVLVVPTGPAPVAALCPMCLPPPWCHRWRRCGPGRHLKPAPGCTRWPCSATRSRGR